MTTLTLTLISIATWLTPMPQHTEGKLIAYGSQHLVEVNAEWRGYTLDPYRERCGVAVMSPADLGKIVWLSVDSASWYGPCLAIDVAQRKHLEHYVNNVHDIAEVSFDVAAMFGFTNGIDGEVYVGACPPPRDSIPQPYRVTPTYSTEHTPSFCCPYARQEWPTQCEKGKGRTQ